MRGRFGVVVAVLSMVALGAGGCSLPLVGDEGQPPIVITDPGEDFYEGTHDLDAGRYEITVEGTKAVEPANFAMNINGEDADYYRLPINEIVEGGGAYAKVVEADVPESGEARIQIGGGGVTGWTVRIEMVDPA